MNNLCLAVPAVVGWSGLRCPDFSSPSSSILGSQGECQPFQLMETDLLRTPLSPYCYPGTLQRNSTSREGCPFLMGGHVRDNAGLSRCLGFGPASPPQISSILTEATDSSSRRQDRESRGAPPPMVSCTRVTSSLVLLLFFQLLRQQEAAAAEAEEKEELEISEGKCL